MKVNFDAHLGSNFHRGLSVVIRNEHGELLAVGSRKLVNNWDVKASEAATACYGLELALSLGYEKILLDGDA